MENEFLINEYKNARNENAAFNDKMNVLKESWSNELVNNGLGENIVNEIKMMEKPKKMDKIKNFFYRLINTI